MRDMAGYGGISKFPFFQVCLFFVVKMIGGVVKVFLGPSFPTLWIQSGVREVYIIGPLVLMRQVSVVTSSSHCAY